MDAVVNFSNFAKYIFVWKAETEENTVKNRELLPFMWKPVTNLGNCRFLLSGFYCMENRKTIVKLRSLKHKPNAPTKRHRQPLRTLKPNNLTTFKPQPYLKIYLKLYKQNPATCIFNLLPATGHVCKGEDYIWDVFVLDSFLEPIFIWYLGINLFWISRNRILLPINDMNSIKYNHYLALIHVS